MATRTQTRRRRASKTKPRGPRSRERHWLYQESVQSPEVHFGFFDRVFRERNGRKPRVLKEDFCGTALLAREWVLLREDNVAIGVDLDAPTLRWGRERNLNTLEPDERRRVILKRANVLDVTTPKVEMVVALNFSYNIFHTRDELRAYFAAARRSLRPGGLFIGDSFGGWEAQKPMKERTRHSGFTYIWDQDKFDPIRNNGVYHIHFEFHDGGGIRRAFTYDWRLWSIPEILELLEEAGFHDVKIYWEEIDRSTGFGNSKFRRQRTAVNSEGWIAYFVAGVSRKKRA
jgi:SAM-dependent methyltransferase